MEPHALGHVTPARIGSVADGIFTVNDQIRQSSEGLSKPLTVLGNTNQTYSSRSGHLQEKFLQDLKVSSEGEATPDQIKRAEFANIANNAWDQKCISSKNWFKHSLFGFDSDPQIKTEKPKVSSNRQKMIQQINLFVGENLANDPDTDFEKI